MIQQFHFQLKRTESRDSKRHLHTHVHSSMIHERQKQPKCPSMGEWISKMLSIQLNGMLLLLLPSRFSRVRLCATPWTAAHQASSSMGFSRQEHWSGLPFPSPTQRTKNRQFISFRDFSKALKFLCVSGEFSSLCCFNTLFGPGSYISNNLLGIFNYASHWYLTLSR